ncbi:hypothetical protein QUA56_21425 [Microcoleus sp. N3A4]|uniref:hypothetical protein n=1 Tax=Microcoleus sp. N3A4 TaxID=3055379 RepID=UPI002FCE83C0
MTFLKKNTYISIIIEYSQYPKNARAKPQKKQNFSQPQKLDKSPAVEWAIVENIYRSTEHREVAPANKKSTPGKI